MSFLDETGYRHLYQKIVNKVQALWQKVGTATLTTNAQNTSEAVNELKQSLDDLNSDYFETTFNNIAVPSDIQGWTSCYAKSSVPAGTYMLFTVLSFATETSAEYKMGYYIGNTTTPLFDLKKPQGGWVTMSGSALIKLTSASTVGIFASQNSGASVDVKNGIFRLIKLR